MRFVHRSVLMLLDIPLSPLQSLGTCFIWLQHRNCSAPPPTSPPVCPVQVGAVLGGCPLLRDAQTVAEVLAQAGTPALFVLPAASETVILCIKRCFQSSSWWDSGFGSSEQEIQAACKTLKPHIPTCPGWVKQTGLYDVVRAADPQLAAFNQNNSKKEHTHRGVASGIDFLRDWGRSEAVRSLTFPFAPV